MNEKIRVLYVDDDPSLLEIGKRYLEKSGVFLVDISNSGIEGLIQLSKGSYDAVISDYEMPEMDGISFLKVVKSSGNKIPFIIFTGKGREEIVIEALNHGADFYLQKGGSLKSLFAELSNKIQYAVRQRKIESSLQESENRFRLLSNISRDCILIFNETDTIIDCNQQVLDFFGYEREEIIGMRGLEFFVDNLSYNSITRWRNEGGYGTLDISGMKKDGTLYYGEINSSSISWLGKKYSFFLIHDVTEQIKIDELLRGQQEELITVLRQLSDAEQEIRSNHEKLTRQIEELRQNEMRLRKNVELSTGISY